MTARGCVEPHAAYIVHLRDVTRAQTHHAGVKAANLADLARAGFPVPEGFVLTNEAFGRFLIANGLTPDTTPDRVAAAPLPSDITDALFAAAASLGDAPLAVRSSSTAEDLPGASYAGQFESVLDVRGPDDLKAAVRRCWASAFNPSARIYQSQISRSSSAWNPGMAVLIQRLIRSDAAGVAFTANPITGDRGETFISAVRGLGDRLVSGHAAADEWVVRQDEAVCQQATEAAIAADQARDVAELARRVEEHFGAPQDVEWAMAGGKLFVLQARPITALPQQVEWNAPVPGAWARHFRLGEWLGAPVTPLFESWLLTRLEERLHANYREIAGVPPPDPIHVIVHGWYFYSLNFLPATPFGMARLMLRHVLPKLIVQPRRVAMMFPSTAGLGVELFLPEWRDLLLPRYCELVRSCEATVDHITPRELVDLIDQIADTAGDYFTSITLVTGFAWKAEVPLASFYRKHLHSRIGGGYQRLLCGLSDPAVAATEHAVESLDWFYPTLGEGNSHPVDATGTGGADNRRRTVIDRKMAEANARAALAREPKLRRRFDQILSTAQRFAPVREEQVASFTLGWPVMRRALLRLGAHLCQQGVIVSDGDIFFLTRGELLAAIDVGDTSTALSSVLTRRRQEWQRQHRLIPPLVLGEAPPTVKRMFDGIEATFRPELPATQRDGLLGLPASPGCATGPARVIRSPEEFDRLGYGDVLVVPAITPAWVPLFSRAAAVVADTGSPMAHASLIAREYGIPAVVGTGNATARLQDGQIVTVEGNTGQVKVQV